MPSVPFRLIGRDLDRGVVVAAIEADAPIVVVGEAGVGKTTLVRAAAALAGRPLIEGGALALLAWHPYLAIERALGQVVAHEAASVLQAAIEGVGNGVLFLEDLQWANPATLALLGGLAGRIALVASVRDGDPGAEAALSATREAGFGRRDLGPLDESDALAMVTGLRSDLPSADRRRIARTSGGNPLFIEEMSRVGEVAPVLDAVIRIRLDALSPEAAEAMVLLSRAEAPLSVAEVGPSAAELVRAGLVVRDGERVSLRHERLGAAAVGRLEAEAVREIDRRLARMAAEPGLAARHHLRAGERTLAHAKAVEAAAAATSAAERAAHLLLAADTAPVAGANQSAAAAFRLDAVGALIQAGRAEEAQEELDHLGVVPPTLAVRHARLIAMTLRHRGMPKEARRAALAALEVPGLDTESEIALRIEIARSSSFDADHLAEAIDLARAALVRAAEGDRHVAAARLAYGQALFRAGHDGWEPEIRAGLELALAQGDLEAELSGRNSLIFALLRDGRPLEAVPVAEAYEGRGRALGLLPWVWGGQSWLAGLYWHGGRFAEALAIAESIASVGTADEEGFYQAQAALDLGRIEEGRVRAARLLEDKTTGEFRDGEALWAAADAALAGGRWVDAHALAVEHAVRYHDAQHRPFVALIEGWAAFELGRLMPDARGPSGLRLLAGAPLELAALDALAAGDPAAAAPFFDMAAAAWDGRHVRGALRSRWAAAEARRRAGRVDAARTELLSLEAQLQEIGAFGLLPRVRRSLRQAGVRRSAERTASTSPITAREREILGLVAGGLRDQEIARRLGISRWGVTRVIESASAKLGAGTRAQAIARLAS